MMARKDSKLTDGICVFSDLSDVPENLPMPAPGSESPQALNYSQIASAAVAVSQGGQDLSVSSTETLLRNIQGLLKVAADNARQQERQINYEKGQWQSFLGTLRGISLQPSPSRNHIIPVQLSRALGSITSTNVFIQ